MWSEEDVYGSDEDFGGGDAFGSDGGDFSFGESKIDVELLGPRTKTKDYEIMTTAKLKKAKSELVTNVAEFLSVSSDVAELLLRQFVWNKEKLLSRMVDRRDTTLDESHLSPFVTPPPVATTQTECTICGDEQPQSEMFALPCQHAFCKGCWANYLRCELESSGKSIIHCHCPHFKCRTPVPASAFQQLLDQALFAKFERFLLKSFVEDSSRIKWCPAPNCTNAVRASNAIPTTVKCSCGMKFCFQCNEESHLPIECRMLQEWLEKCQNESETAHWIMANTKICPNPNCKVRIEKNQGCNHMQCPSCKHEFCWVCLDAWTSHGVQTGGYYRCNLYDPKASTRKDGEGVPEVAKAELARYLHYYQRYHNHDQSKKFAIKQYEVAERRMKELQKKSKEDGNGGSTWMDVQFLKAAVDAVFECRQVLKYTYVLGYYMDEESSEKKLFEFLQQDLEKNTELLSELSEAPLEALDPTEVANYTGVTKKFLENLLEGVERGLTASPGAVALTGPSTLAPSLSRPDTGRKSPVTPSGPKTKRKKTPQRRARVGSGRKTRSAARKNKLPRRTSKHA